MSGAIVFLLWFVGVVVGATVVRARAGLPTMRKLGPSELEGGYGWFATRMVLVCFWPVTLAVWLARRMPPPTVRFERDQRGGFRRVPADQPAASRTVPPVAPSSDDR
ncbi:hypothetical protein ThrDRAFT_03388 [Frankia casuarinae]|jgi:hypothetical protein|uniref:hypothetical protein n=1 Tax=Frankia TaxID=1854 RepID=UPI0004495B1F|nr:MULTISPECIES: hypothetical protein [Frankia]EYT90984.1 hypothetical protein ThrDRAFT_03388 [Frankia casuarinae]KDA41547.1 hypothetical protein BMG523Draft_03615 [Frankia sp. BMG5.23]KEZ34988.1 hypothetical protein CEDDRAFT_03665 [Frankia sp. CeD]ORT48826.1 hypothetical protein KBI5_15235 [Frankia sp. KB5]TFE25498.1 hypothetical protein E0F15_19725 [Frankia sp. B2]